MLSTITFAALGLFFQAALAMPAAVEVAHQLSAPLEYPVELLGYQNLTFADGLEKRQEGGVYITTDINYGGTTGYAKQNWDVCIKLDDPWYHTISSLGPDSGNAVVYSENRDCNNPGGAIWYPGEGDLRNIGWNDRIGSFVVRQVAVVNGHECVYGVFAGINCQRCCNGCNRSGQGCCPNGLHC